MHAAAFGGLAQRLPGDGDDPAVADGRHIGNALVMTAVEHGDFTDDFAAPELADRMSGLGDLKLAFEDQAEKIAGLPIAHQAAAGGYDIPAGDADDFPDLDIGEVIEKTQLAQGFEFLAVRKALLPEGEFMAAECLGKIVGKGRPAGITIRE